MIEQLIAFTAAERHLTALRFQGLAEVPSELEWFANIDNKSTRRSYENALQNFMGFTGIRQPGKFRIVTPSHVIAWRDELVGRALSGMTTRHRLAALSSLFEHLCESNAVGSSGRRWKATKALAVVALVPMVLVAAGRESCR